MICVTASACRWLFRTLVEYNLSRIYSRHRSIETDTGVICGRRWKCRGCTRERATASYSYLGRVRCTNARYRKDLVDRSVTEEDVLSLLAAPSDNIKNTCVTINTAQIHVNQQELCFQNNLTTPGRKIDTESLLELNVAVEYQILFL